MASETGFENGFSAELYVALGAIFATICGIFALNRCAMSIILLRKLKLADLPVLEGIIIVAWVSTTALFKIDHRAIVSTDRSNPLVVAWTIAVDILYNVALWSSKAPILLLYIELFGVKRWLRYSSYVTLAITSVALLVAMCYTFGKCNMEIEMNSQNVAACVDRLMTSNLVSGLVSIIADIVILCIPFRAISQLNLLTA
ncbi:uncharacterized protein F4822DRAFT_429147 [Hypoxylon trugodes]|uniref:uncharacterized protein n=1 Tax=Hypoxylon trugodes TaxID=326681 RepID=UPI00218D5EE5|nr:uncharacterized protein F4822DRAFT_429147 [Hypoxylon trugodes]KAI1388527.1 hypothetical protein F4822DRAFT_429147 [Hypoxylon trugodes]